MQLCKPKIYPGKTQFCKKNSCCSVCGILRCISILHATRRYIGTKYPEYWIHPRSVAWQKCYFYIWGFHSAQAKWKFSPGRVKIQLRRSDTVGCSHDFLNQSLIWQPFHTLSMWFWYPVSSEAKILNIVDIMGKQGSLTSGKTSRRREQEAERSYQTDGGQGWTRKAGGQIERVRCIPVTEKLLGGPS